MTDPSIALPYRPCVGIMLLNPDRQVFVGRRVETVIEAWQMPQGGIDSGEDPATAALRELGEEVGTHKAEILAESPSWYSYDLPGHLIGKAWGGRYRGQRMKWFALRFLGTDDDIDVNTAHPEFDDWRWVDMRQVTQLVVPFKRAMYEQVIDAFHHLGPI